ncbi:MAG: D-alanyl-D-alanine carboxypeptidase [Clostridia bacterium]|nr:D-alanyl-D-alanine carboxypeptidase [Clostridia bacterium]
MHIKNFLLKILYIFLGLSILFNYNIIVFATDNYTWSTYTESVEASNNTTENISSNPLNLESGGAILIDQNSGQILYEHNSHEQLRPASVTKVMSILLIMEALDSGQITLNDKVPCSEKASSMGGSQIWLTTTETLTVSDMLKSICVVSANDCTVAMAEFLCGSTDAFVEKMNSRAKELGMNDTCFKNCHGIDEDGHVTSSYDIALMSRELLQNHPSITNYTTIWMDSIRGGESELVNTNKLVRNYEGCTGLKTGSTSLALYNLSASATRNNLSLIAVIMKAPTTAIRFSEAKALLDYGFSNYSSTELATANDIVKSVSVEKGVEDSVNAVFSENKSCLISKGQESKISQQINIPDSISAPVTRGQKIGEINYYLDDKLLCSVDIVSDKDVEKNSFMSMSAFIIRKWFSLLRI